MRSSNWVLGLVFSPEEGTGTETQREDMWDMKTASVTKERVLRIPAPPTPCCQLFGCCVKTKKIKINPVIFVAQFVVGLSLWGACQRTQVPVSGQRIGPEPHD